MTDAPQKWPHPKNIAPVKAQNDWNGDDWLICSFGNSNEDGKDWVLATDAVRASELVDCYFPSDAKHDAEFLVRLLTAYRDGELPAPVGFVPADVHAAALERIAALEGALRGLIARYDEVVTTPDCSCSQDDHDVQVARVVLMGITEGR